MDQDAYHKTYREINERNCLFEKGILANQCNCPQASRFYLAERIGVNCGYDEGQTQCNELLELLLHQARFTLKSTHELRALPHAKAIRLQVGGLRGLHSSLYPGEEVPIIIDDVFQLIRLAKKEFQSLEQLPFQEIIKQMAAYQGRSRRSKR